MSGGQLHGCDSLNFCGGFARLVTALQLPFLPARFPGSSMVEHSAVNRRVASSNLARGAIPYDFANLDETPPTRKYPIEVFEGGLSLP
jgi:hypothetical protein